MTRLFLFFRLWRAQRSHRWYRREADRHHKLTKMHKDARAEYLRRAQHDEAEIARLRKRIAAVEPVGKRVEV